MIHSIRPRLAHSAVLGLLVVAVAVVGLLAAKQPAAVIPTELQYVPHDAALFVHVDAAKIWSHEITKSFRTADKATFASLAESTTKVVGMSIDDLKSVTVFFPKLKVEAGVPNFGVVLSFTKAFDKNKLEAGAAHLIGNDIGKLAVLSPTDKIAVMLFGLGDEYSKPRPKNEEGPITVAIKAAASGKHTLVVAGTFANLPDELQKDDLPPQVLPFQPILHSQSLTVTFDLGKSLDLNVRVLSKRPAQAVDAEKAMGLLVKMIAEEGERALGMDFPNDGMKDLADILKAGLKAVKAAKFEVDGNEARLSASMPLKDLPFVTAYLAAAQKIQGAAARTQASNNLKQIALAMHNYHDTHNTMPPAAVCDKNGKPMLSWRVLILPYIEQEQLYKQFKLDEPWDSEHNKKLLAKMPKVYALPGVTKPDGTDTHFRVFVGNGAAFDWLKGTKLQEMADGTSNTLLCVTAATAVPWTKPDELEFDPEKDMNTLIGVNNKTLQFAMCDGSVRAASTRLKKETLNAIITRSGGEVIGDDF